MSFARAVVDQQSSSRSELRALQRSAGTGATVCLAAFSATRCLLRPSFPSTAHLAPGCLRRDYIQRDTLFGQPLDAREVGYRIGRQRASLGSNFGDLGVFRPAGFKPVEHLTTHAAVAFHVADRQV